MKQPGNNPYRNSSERERETNSHRKAAYERAKLVEQNRREREEYLRQQEQRNGPAADRGSAGAGRKTAKSVKKAAKQGPKPKPKARPKPKPQKAKPKRPPLTEAQKRRRSMLFRLGLAVVLLCSVVALSCTVLFPIKTVEVVGNNRYTAEEIQLTSGIRQEQNLFRAGVGWAEKALKQQYPYISQVKLQRRLPGTLRIVVTEAQPQCKIKTAEGILVLDGRARVLEVLKEDDGVAAPYVVQSDGVATSPGNTIYPERPEMLKLHLELMDMLQQRELLDRITYITYADRFDIRLLYDGRIEVKLGNQADLDKKLDSLDESLAMLSASETGTLNLNSTNLEKRYFLPKGTEDIFPWWERPMDRVTVVEGTPSTSPGPVQGGSLGSSEQGQIPSESTTPSTGGLQLVPGESTEPSGSASSSSWAASSVAPASTPVVLPSNMPSHLPDNSQ